MKHAFAAALALFGAAAAHAQPQTTDLLVELSSSASVEQIANARAAAGTLAIQRLPNIGAEIWRIPRANVPMTIAQGGPSRLIIAAGLLNDDYRTLFSQMTTGADITPAQTRALATLQSRPELTDVRTVRLRPGQISSRMLLNGFDSADGFTESGSVQLNLAPDLSVTAVRQNLHVTSEDAFEWVGAVMGRTDLSPETGAVSLVVRGDRITGTATVDNQTYVIRPLGGGLHAVARLDQSRLPEEHPPSAIEAFAPRPEADGPPPPPDGALGAAAVLSVGVLVTPGAERQILALGVTLDEFASLAIAESNAGLTYSRIPGRFALAGVRQVAFSGGDDWEENLRALYRTNDGALDDIHEWRRQVRANVVVMIVEQTDYCGLASGFNVPRPRAFALVSYNCATGYFSFAHEIGHLLGARHDPDNDPTDTPFAWGHGFRHQNRWRTIMAYGGGSCGQCPRINAWSNPMVMRDGIAMGSASLHHDARVVTDNIGPFSNY